MRLSLLIFCLGFSTAALVGQCSNVDVKAEEAKIREMMKTGRAVFTEDSVRWNGAYKRPSVGAQESEAFPDAALGKRKNQKSASSIQRVEVAACGDMAWLYSTGTLDYDVDQGHVSFERAELTVLKKIDGQWKVAAMFARPMDVPFVQSHYAK